MGRLTPLKVSFVSLFRSERGSWSLIGMLASLVIMMVLAIILLRGPEAFTGNNSGSGSGALSPTAGVGGAIAARNRAKDTVCENNLQQIRLALQMAGVSEEGYPQSLQVLTQQNPGLQMNCPVGGEQYQYDSSTGKVSCVHPGHERF